MSRVAIGLGGNLGDAQATMRAVFGAIAGIEGVALLAGSSLYRTPAWGGIEQPDFINAAALVETALAPQALLDALLAIERAHGRDRARETRWGPRALDLDILLVDARVIDEPGLRVPHPRLHQRAFALLPLLEVWPDAHIPGIGPAREALSAVTSDGIQRLG